jgi:hypothetical protein
MIIRSPKMKLKKSVKSTKQVLLLNNLNAYFMKIRFLKWDKVIYNKYYKMVESESREKVRLFIK